jgi:hypothetical protein
MGALGLTAALGAAAGLRLIGTAFLGRPRSPRGAAADEAARPALAACALLAACLVLVGLLPGPTLALAGPALHGLLGADDTARSGAVMLVPLAGLPPYSAPGIAGLVVLAILLAWWAVRRWSTGGERAAPAWESGFAAPPPWLPFGDPLTEPGPDAFAAGLRRLPGFGADPAGRFLLPAFRRAQAWAAERTDRLVEAGESLPVILGVLALMLLALWLGGA